MRERVGWVIQGYEVAAGVEHRGGAVALGVQDAVAVAVLDVLRGQVSRRVVVPAPGLWKTWVRPVSGSVMRSACRRSPSSQRPVRLPRRARPGRPRRPAAMVALLLSVELLLHRLERAASCG